MLSKRAKDLGFGLKECYHLIGGGALTSGCSGQTLTALF